MTGKTSSARATCESALLAEARALSGEFDKLSQAVAERVGLSTTELLAVDLVSRGVDVSAGFLAQELHLTTGAVTGLIDRLEKAGFVRRSPHPTDRRRVMVKATAKEKRIRELFGALDDSLRQVMEAYSIGDLAMLTSFIRRLRSVVSGAADRIVV